MVKDLVQRNAIAGQVYRMISIAPTNLPIRNQTLGLALDHVPESESAEEANRACFLDQQTEPQTDFIQPDVILDDPVAGTTPLPASDTATLEDLESILTQAKRWAMAEARALLSIQERELWKATEFKSFEKYATTRWGYEQAQIYRLTGSVSAACTCHAKRSTCARSWNGNGTSSICPPVPATVPPCAIQ